MIRKLLIGLVALLIAVILIGWLWFQSSAPILDGELKLAGLREEVKVTFDEFGVPHIQAQNEHDAYLA